MSTDDRDYRPMPPPDKRPTAGELAAMAGAGLRCPSCGHDGHFVLYGRHDTEGPSKWRKRECRRCHAKFWAEETVRGLADDSNSTASVRNSAYRSQKPLEDGEE